MLIIIPTLYPKPEHRATFLSALKKNAASAVRDEPGCRRFEVLQQEGDPNQIVLLEVYDNEAAFQAHLKTPHFARFSQVMRGKTAKPATILRCVTLHPSNAVFKALKK